MGGWDTGWVGHRGHRVSVGGWDIGWMGHRAGGTQGGWDTGWVGHRVGGTQGGWDTGWVGHRVGGILRAVGHLVIHTHTHLHRFFSSVRAVLQGACHMVAMQIAGEPLVRQTLRQVFQSRAVLSAKPTKKGRKVDTVPHARCISSQELGMNLEDSSSLL